MILFKELNLLINWGCLLEVSKSKNNYEIKCELKQSHAVMASVNYS